MKLTNQDIPPALLAEYKKLVATKPADLAGVAVARTTKRARAPAPTRPPRKEFRDYEKAVDFLIDYLTTKDGHPPAAGFRAEQINNIKIGYFDPAYWTQCAQDSADVFTNTPSSAAWSGARAYAYPDPANLPSVPTYGAGVASSGNLDYTGATVSGTFKDLALKWKRYVFSLANSFARTSDEPLFFKLTGSVSATANVRASRAMLSAIIKRWIVLPGSTRLTTTEAPTTTPIQAFWRYRTPRGASPYYAYTNSLRLVYSMRSLAREAIAAGGAYKYEEAPGDLTKCVVLVAPMPMMGKRFNNNTSVAVTLTGTVELWQIKKGAGGFVVGNKIIHIDGTTETVTPPAVDLFYMWDGLHGLAEYWDDAAGALRWATLDKSLTVTPFTAPWQADAGWDSTGYVQSYNAAASGWLVSTNVNGNPYMDYWFLDYTGAQTAHYDDTTAPNLFWIAGGNPNEVEYMPALNQYAFNQQPYSGLTEIDIFDAMGGFVTSYDYYNFTDWVTGTLFTSEDHAYTLWPIGSAAPFSAQLWRMDSTPGSIIATLDIGSYSQAGVSYHAGVFYIWPRDATKPAYAVTEAGVVTNITNPNLVNLYIARPWSLPYKEA